MRQILLLVVLSILFQKCGNDEVEVYSFEDPIVVEFVETNFYPRQEPSAEYEFGEPDRLEIAMMLHHEFEFGLFSSEIDPPYNELDLIVDSNEDTVLLSNEIQPPLYKLNPAGEKVLFSEGDNRTEFNCLDYAIIAYDTFFVQRNPFFYNLLVDLVDFNKKSFFNSHNSKFICTPFSVLNSRVPMGYGETHNFIIEKISEYSMKIKYSIGSNGLSYLIADKPFTIQLAAIDRELNISDTITVDIESLQSIQD